MGRPVTTEAVYGDPRTFDNKVKAIPYVGPDGIILRVVIIDMDGDERLAADIKQRYTGAAYSTWMQGNDN